MKPRHRLQSSFILHRCVITCFLRTVVVVQAKSGSSGENAASYSISKGPPLLFAQHLHVKRAMRRSTMMMRHWNSTFQRGISSAHRWGCPGLCFQVPETCSPRTQSQTTDGRIVLDQVACYLSWLIVAEASFPPTTIRFYKLAQHPSRCRGFSLLEILDVALWLAWVTLNDTQVSELLGSSKSETC